MRFFFVSSLLLAYSAIVSAVADDSCTVETMATFGEWQKGFCVLSNNRDQNSGVKLLEAGDFLDKKFEKDEDKVAHCLHLCACHKEDPVTGCEMIWNQSNRGCYVHTDFIAKGNGVERHSCYLATSPGSWGDNGRVCSASLWGDPHAVTYDGLKFDAQPAGEALLLKTLGTDSGLEVQARFEKVGGGRRGNPAVTTGVAIRSESGTIVQVSIPTYDEPSDEPTVSIPRSAWQKGFCLNGGKEEGGVWSGGYDQNSGVIKLESGDFLDKEDEKDEEKVEKCLAMCVEKSKYGRVTGCEMIWSQGNKGCYAHTQPITYGNGVPRHSCYLAEQLVDRPPVPTITAKGHECEVELLVNGERQEGLSLDADSVSVSHEGQKISVEIDGEIGVDMRMSHFGRCFFSADFHLYNCDDREENTIGLLGSPDGSSTNDWMTQDNEILDIPDNVGGFFFEPAFEYVKDNWILDDEEDSIFDHKFEGFEELSDPDEEYDPELEDLVNDAGDVEGCVEGDIGCIIDNETLGEDAKDEYNDNPACNREPVEEIHPTTAPTVSPTETPGELDELEEETDDEVKLGDPDTPEEEPKGPGSGSGDPHFKTWTGDKYDYHGECDLVLVDHPEFANGKGMKVHIRTSRVKYFSYISNIAVQIGDDVLEFNNDVDNFLINGKRVEKQKKWVTTYLGGFHVRRDPKAISLRFDEVHKAKIDLIQRQNGFPAVVVDGGTSEIFKGSLGLLGDWETGKRLARDGKTEMNEPDATGFALEWQVRDTEPMLFSAARFPQYPTTCTPPAKRLTNRLGVSSFEKEAEKACAHWKEDKEDCIFDVIATRDISVAAEGSVAAMVA